MRLVTVPKIDDPLATNLLVKVGAVNGIGIYMHLSFVLVVIVLYLLFGGNIESFVFSVLLTCFMFLSVVLHAFFHLVYLRKAGIRMTETLIYPIGVVSRFNIVPDGVIEALTFLIAPFGSIFVGTVLISLLNGSWPSDLFVVSYDNLLFFVALFNIFLGLFNLLPVFPLDGARVLRGILSIFLQYETASNISIFVGILIAILLTLSFPASPLSWIFLFFAILSATAETSMTKVISLVAGRPVKEVMEVDFKTISVDASPIDAVKVLKKVHHDFLPVVTAGGNPRGVINLERALQFTKLQNRGILLDNLKIGNIAIKVPVVEPESILWEYLPEITSTTTPAVVLVSKNGNLIGMVTRNSVEKFMLIVDFLRSN